MKKYFTIIIVFAFIKSINAQNENLFSKALSISIGASNPQGDLSKTNINDSSSGYAKRGAALALNFEYSFPKGIGFYAQYYTTSMALDNAKLASDAEKDLGFGWKNSVIKTSGYKISALNFGLMYTINKNHKFQIIPRLGFGFSNCTNRKIDATFKNSANTTRYNFEDGKASAVNINWGFDLSYRVSKKIIILAKFVNQVQVPQFDVKRQAYLNGFLIKEEKKKETVGQLFSGFLFGIKYRI